MKIINANETLVLRHKILRPHQCIEKCVFEGDELENTFHLGGYMEDDLVAILSCCQQNNIQWNDGYQWRIRGMAVTSELQGQGYGQQLVTRALFHLRDHSLHSRPIRVWLNARENARHFYEKLGFELIGEPFEIEGIGFHWLMTQQV